MNATRALSQFGISDRLLRRACASTLPHHGLEFEPTVDAEGDVSVKVSYWAFDPEARQNLDDPGWVMGFTLAVCRDDYTQPVAGDNRLVSVTQCDTSDSRPYPELLDPIIEKIKKLVEPTYVFCDCQEA